MELILLNPDAEDLDILEQINEEAIPVNERISFEDLFSTGGDGNLSIIGIYEEREPIGFFVIREHGNICYLAYFAIRNDLRSKGIGGKALQMLLARYPDKQVLVEFESPEDPSDERDVRVRRKGFYLRNGFRKTGWNAFYDGEDFEIGCANRDFDSRELLDFIEYLGTIATDHIPKPYKKEA